YGDGKPPYVWTPTFRSQDTSEIPTHQDRRYGLSVASECSKGVSCEFCFTTLTTGSPATSCPTSGCSCCRHSHLPDMKSCWSMAMPNLWTKPKLCSSSATRTSGWLVSVP